MSNKTNTNQRDENLTHAIVELISVHPGISHNKIINKLKEEGFSSHSAIAKKLNELHNLDIIEYQTGSDNMHHFYIQGVPKSKIHYDKKLSALITDLKKTLDEIEEDSPEHSQNIRNHYYEVLEETTSSIKIPNYLKEQPVIFPEDNMIEEILAYSIYRNDEIQNKIQAAENLHKEIQKLKIKKSNAIQKIIKTKDDAKKGLLCTIIIESSKDIHNSLKCMMDYLNALTTHKHIHQKNIFGQVFDALNTQLPKPTKNYHVLRELESIQRSTSDIIVQQKLNDIISHFYKEIQKPVKKNLLIKKLVETGQFSKNDAYEILHEMSGITGGWVLVNKDDVYPVHPGYPLSSS